MKIAIGSDHAGFELKQKIAARLKQQGHDVTDEGTLDTNSVDYPDYARKVGHDVAAGRAQYGVLVCGSGIGMAIAANKVPGVRAAQIGRVEEAQLSREHNNLNVLAIGARLTGEDDAYKIVDTFLKTGFSGGRHAQRVEKIAQIESEERTHSARK
jgi:ribose 5-phosphate isomerase B